MPYIRARESYTAFRNLLLPHVTPGSRQIPAEIYDSLAYFTLLAAQRTYIATLSSSDGENSRISEPGSHNYIDSYTAFRDLSLALFTPGSRQIPAEVYDSLADFTL